MATNMALHNLVEICNALCSYINNPEITIDELMRYVTGPDFPTGGITLPMDKLIIFTGVSGSGTPEQAANCTASYIGQFLLFNPAGSA
jgi:DNA gyrase/topoisomerase IV subunit A